MRQKENKKYRLAQAEKLLYAFKQTEGYDCRSNEELNAWAVRIKQENPKLLEGITDLSKDARIIQAMVSNPTT